LAEIGALNGLAIIGAKRFGNVEKSSALGILFQNARQKNRSLVLRFNR